MSPTCLGALHGRLPSNGANWQCQAMVLIGNAKQATVEGKSGPVETRLTGPAATALCRLVVLAIW